MNIWDKVKYFKPNENWGDPNKISWALLFVLDTIREQLPSGCSIHINCGYEQGGHASKSYHSREGKGGAVDFVVKGLPLHIAFEIITKLLKDMNIIYGLGVYPNWNTAGFHLDIRDSSVYWIASGNVKNQTYAYYEDSRDVLQRLINMRTK